MKEYNKVYCFENKEMYKGVRDASRQLDISPMLISLCCRDKLVSAKGKHFCFEKNVNVIKERRHKRSNHKVYCKELDKTFESVNEAAEYFKLCRHTIYERCNHPQKTKIDGKYTIEYANKDVSYKTMHKTIPLVSPRKCRCIETNRVFESLAAATEWCGLKKGSASISFCCRKYKMKTAGGYHWEYAD